MKIANLDTGIIVRPTRVTTEFTEILPPPQEIPPETSVADLKATLTELVTVGETSVRSVRDAFVVGTAPLQVASSGSIGTFLTTFVRDEKATNLVKATSHFGLMTAPAPAAVPPPRPELDKATIVDDHGGVLDQYSVKLTISVKESEIKAIKSVKIFRAKKGKVVTAPRPLVAALSALPPVHGVNADRLGTAAFRAAEIGVGNVMTDFIAVDPMADRFNVASPAEQELRAPVPPINNNRTTTPAKLVAIDGVDRSVLENIAFYTTRRSVGDLPVYEPDSISVGRKIGINVLGTDAVGKPTGAIIAPGNSPGFAEIANFDPMKCSSRKVGDFVELTITDRSVVYGAGYLYYACCVGLDGTIGMRSRILDVSVIVHLPPPTPEVTYSIVGGLPRFSIRCKKGSSHVEVFRAGRVAEESVVFGSEESLVISGPATQVGEYSHVGDIGLGPDGSTTYVDKGAVSGDRLQYRIYAVDAYGLKSQTPFSCEIKMPDHGHVIPVPIPSVTVEQASGQKALIVRARVNDPRVIGFMMTRRVVTISERAVHQANQPELFDLGVTSAKRAGSRSSPTMQDVDWPSYFPAVSGAMNYTDTTARVDRVYQYAISAVDARGNRSPLAGSQPIGVFSKPIIDSPVSVSAKVQINEGQPSSVVVSWTGGTSDFSPLALIGDQDDLDASRVRSAYQVERREVGAPFWDAMPATTESYFIDPVSEDASPPYRPGYATIGKDYEYRVLTLQSGGFVSQRTDQIAVSIVAPPKGPEIVWVRTTSVGVFPMGIVVSWMGKSDFVTHWEVQRAVTNKIYGARITSLNSPIARGLDYVTVAKVTPESSRASSLSSADRELDARTYVGNRFYIDGDVDQANSYFYRVRTIGRGNDISDWTYGGIMLTDSPFDLKFTSTLTDDERVLLANIPRPIRKGIP